MSENWISIATDPNHIIAEIIWNLIFDGVVITLFYGVIIKKIIMPHVRKNIHKYIDDKHGVMHKKEEY